MKAVETVISKIIKTELWLKIIELVTYSHCLNIAGVLYWPIRILDRNSPFCNWKCNPLNSWLLYFIHFCWKWFIAVWSSLTPAVIYHEDKHSSFSLQKAFTNHFQLSITQVTRIHTQPLNAQPGPQLFTQIHWPCEEKGPPCINHFNLRCTAVTAVIHKYSHTKVMDWVLLARLSSATSCLQSKMIVL